MKRQRHTVFPSFSLLFNDLAKTPGFAFSSLRLYRTGTYYIRYGTGTTQKEKVRHH
jgi:hypothetical protein